MEHVCWARGLALVWAIVAATAAGCAAPDYVAGRRAAPVVSPDIAHAEGRLVAPDGVSILRQSWRARGSRPKAALVIVHGLKDHSSRYAWPAEHLARAGYAVHAFDLRGHGDSSGERVYIDSFDRYVADLAGFVAWVKQREPGLPVFVFGHSMGGAIVALYALEHPHEPAGVVLSGAALKPGEDVSGFLIFMTGLLGTIAPGLDVLDLPNEAFSKDPEVVAAMAADPLIAQEPGPASTADALLGAIAEIQERMDAFETPVLLLHGLDDKLTNPDGSRELHTRAASTDKTLELYPGLWHDLLHEPERDMVLADIQAWLDARVEPQTSRTP